MQNFRLANIRAALLISTYKSSNYLNIVLQSVLRQSVKPDEIIIAEDGEDAQTHTLINLFKKKCNIPIVHVRHEDLGFRKSLILNKAVENITSDYIIEIDGDIVLNKFFIEDHLRLCKRGVFVQGGRVLIGPSKTDQILSGAFININFFTSGIKNRINTLRSLFFADLFSGTTASLKSRGCNLAYWKADYIKVNGYNNDFVGWGLEDTEFSLRMTNAGLKKKMLKFAAICYHLNHQTYSRANYPKNSALLNKTSETKIIYSTNGYKEARYIH